MEQKDASLLGPRPLAAGDRHTTQRPQLVPNRTGRASLQASSTVLGLSYYVS